MSQLEAPAGGEHLTATLTALQGPDFAEHSHLTYVVPSETNVDLEKAFKNLDPGKPIADSIPQRRSLFFDETVNVLLILRTPWADEAILKSHFSRLIISLEAQVVNSNSSGRRDTSPGTDTIFTDTVKDVDDPFIVVDEEGSEAGSEDEQEPNQHIYAVWKLPVYLARPRMRLHHPSIVFSVSASLKPEVSATLNTKSTGYLSSGIPSGFNLLESFNGDPNLHGIKPRLSALRVSRVAPVTQQQDMLKHIRAHQQVKIEIFPVVHSRIRFSRPNTAPSSSSVIALLEVDFTSHFDCEIVLENIELFIKDSKVEGLNDEAGMQLPLTCVSHDHITFMYHITPQELEVTPKNPTRDLDISITAIAHVVPGVCTPKLSMTWTSNLDFTTPVNPGFGPSGGTGIQRGHRPSQLSIGGQAVHPLKSPSVTRPDALPALEASTNQTDLALPELGITMTFTGPSHPIHPGEIFSWTIYIVNRFAEKTSRSPRKLALIAVPKRRRSEVRVMRPPSTGRRRRGEKEIADAVMDENVLHAMQKGSTVDSGDIVCLSADTRIGPLAPGACQVVEMQFLALSEGVLGVEAIRVVDLASQEHVDIRELPTVIVESPVAEAA